MAGAIFFPRRSPPLVRTAAAALRALILAGVALLGAAAVPAQPDPLKSRERLVVVLRESIGANKTDEALKPMGGFTTRLPDGRELTIAAAAWSFIADTHIRFMFDEPDTLTSVTRQDLADLQLATVEEALALALSNLERLYGRPASTPWAGGLMQVNGKSSYLDSSYVLDRAYWRALLKDHPEGVVVAVPKRGGLLWVPLGDTAAVDRLKAGIAELHATSGALRVSSALLLFKDDRWSVFQPAAAP